MIDPEWVAVGIVTALNVGGWAYNRNYSYGKLWQKVSNHEKILNNGLPGKVDELSDRLAKLEGSVSTYIDITKRFIKED